jgi:hypothetical protein
MKKGIRGGTGYRDRGRTIHRYPVIPLPLYPVA